MFQEIKQPTLVTPLVLKQESLAGRHMDAVVVVGYLFEGHAAEVIDACLGDEGMLQAVSSERHAIIVIAIPE